METLMRQTDAALPDETVGALDRLRRFIQHHLTYHVERQVEVFLGNSELRSLEPQNRQVKRPEKIRGRSPDGGKSGLPILRALSESGR